jgi:CAAX prenyl protease-like protein
VYVAWILAAHRLLPAATMPAQLAGLPVATRVMWIAGRVIASVVTVPIAEELAYRGYLMRRLSGGRFDTVPYACVRWPAWLVASIVFGLGHGALWLPGIAAGLAFGWILIRRASLGEAVAAHVTSNALVAVGVLGFDQWQLW